MAVQVRNQTAKPGLNRALSTDRPATNVAEVRIAEAIGYFSCFIAPGEPSILFRIIKPFKNRALLDTESNRVGSVVEIRRRSEI